MKRSVILTVLVCFIGLFLFGNCASNAPPKQEKLYTKHIEGNKLLYVFTFACAAFILTDPDDIEKVKERGLQNYRTVESLFINEGNLGPIIVREGGSDGFKYSVAVFSLPKDIENVMVVGFKTIIRRSGNSYDVSYLWTQEPWIIPVNHSGLYDQAYVLEWNGIATINMNDLSPSRIDQIYSSAVTYGSPHGNKIQPGFIPRR
jgi:hypothetical protein